MSKRFKCDRCENGKIQKYGYIDEGNCWKCNGTGVLLYNPKPNGIITEDDESYREFLENQRYAEEELRAQRVAFMAINKMFDDNDENYYHG